MVTIYSQGVNQSSAGTDKVNAIINCHLATGRIGQPGMGPFSVTGQPNAMGGREVGGLANMLAAHMDLDNASHRRIVRDFWQSPRIAEKPGLKAVDLFRAVGAGKVKALWIMATNPVDSLPDADAVRAAIASCPFVVVSDVVRHTDTTALAHVLLPAAAWGEKDGTVTNSERRISRQRAFLPMPGEARPDWWQIAEVGKRLGYEAAFSYANAAEIFAEHAALSAAENAGTRDFDIGACADITTASYDALAPFQWPQPAGTTPAETRFFANGKFFTPDRRGRFIPTQYRAPASARSAAQPLLLNTGRIRDQWHTMTRTGKTPRLMGHIGEPFLEVHPDDAARHGLTDAGLARVSNDQGAVILRVVVTPRQQPGSLFAPMHWTDQLAANARIDRLMHPNTDPVSGQPELKLSPVAVAPFAAAWYGFVVSAARPGPASDYWALAPAKSGWRAELADARTPDDWTAYARDLLGSEDAELLAYHDQRRGEHRFAAFTADRCLGALFIGPEPVAVARGWAAGWLEAPQPDRLRLLAGRPGAGAVDRGAIVCACFDVGRNQILAARASGSATVTAIGAALSAGTNCGSCRPEIARIIDAPALPQTG